MAITQAVATTFKQELMQGLHNFNTAGGNSFKIALYTSAATLDSSTTTYTASNEVSGTGYTAGGNTLTNVSPVVSGTTAYTDFNDSTWTTATITARGAMIYNSTNGNRTAVILDFGSDKASSAGDFTIIFPAPAAATAIIRIA
jgi:hypothetical protein